VLTAFHVICPACRRLHLARGAPHYCSIACYRSGNGLDDQETGDGRRLCERCGTAYVTPANDSSQCLSCVQERPPNARPPASLSIVSADGSASLPDDERREVLTD
jgi:hypothetical protein